MKLFFATIIVVAATYGLQNINNVDGLLLNSPHQTLKTSTTTNYKSYLLTHQVDRSNNCISFGDRISSHTTRLHVSTSADHENEITNKASSNNNNDKSDKSSNKSKNKTNGKNKKRSSYEKWLEETFNWVKVAPSPLPFEICENAHDLVRGWTKVYPMRTYYNSKVRMNSAENNDYLVRRFVQEKNDGNVYAQHLPSRGMYRMAIEGWTSCAGKKDKLQPAKRIHSLMDMMAEENRKDVNAPEPDIACYVSLIQAYIRSNTYEGLEEANKVLLFLENSFEDSLHTCRLEESEENAETHQNDTILSWRDTENLDECLGYSYLKPQVSAYNAMFNAIIKCNAPIQKRLVLAKSVLERMEHQYIELGNKYAYPTPYSYTSVVSLFTTHQRSQEAEEILRKMENASRVTGDDELKPDTITYNTVMSSWANSMLPNSGEEAQKILNTMEAKPNRRSYNAVILAHAKCGNPVKAQELLDEMQELWEEQKEEKEKESETTDEGQDGDPDFDMKPDIRTFTTVINAWGRSNLPEAAYKAHNILNQMSSLHEATGDETIKPNTITYTAVLDAYAFMETEDSAKHAENLLKEMKEKSKTDSSLIPDVRSYNAILNAYSRSRIPDAGSKADALLSEMENGSDTKPDAFSYNSVILAYVRERNITSSLKALDVLKRMEKAYKNGDKRTKPIANNYNAVMSSLASNSNNADPAVAVEVTKLLDTVESGKGLHPDKFCYSATLYAWSRSSDMDKGKRALEVLERMKKAKVRVDEMNYITVMNACAHTFFTREMDPIEKAKKQSEVFNIAKSVFQELNNDEKLEMSDAVYSVFLRCCKYLIPMYIIGEPVNQDHDENNEEQEETPHQKQKEPNPKRDKVIKALFKKASEEGLISEKMVKELNSKTDTNLFKAIFAKHIGQTNAQTWDNLPHEWKCNVGKHRQRDWKGDVKQ